MREDWRKAKARKEKARAKRMAARAAKQITTSDTGAGTVSAETQQIAPPVRVKVVQGGLPSQGKGGN